MNNKEILQFCETNNLIYGGFVDLNDHLSLKIFIEFYIYEYVKKVCKTCSKCGLITSIT